MDKSRRDELRHYVNRCIQMGITTLTVPVDGEVDMLNALDTIEADRDKWKKKAEAAEDRILKLTGGLESVPLPPSSR